MPVSCVHCGTTMPDISLFCPSCGRPVVRQMTPRDVSPRPAGGEDVRLQPAASTAPGAARGDRLAGALAYCTFVPAVAFLVMKSYQRRRFVRFHAFQSVLFWVLVAVLLLTGLLGSTFGYLFMWLLLGVLVVFAVFFTWVVLTIKALQGEWFRLPGMGKLAEQWAGA